MWLRPRLPEGELVFTSRQSNGQPLSPASSPPQSVRPSPWGEGRNSLRHRWNRNPPRQQVVHEALLDGPDFRQLVDFIGNQLIEQIKLSNHAPLHLKVNHRKRDSRDSLPRDRVEART